MSDLPNDLCLNGEWTRVPDPKGVGLKKKWFEGACPEGDAGGEEGADDVWYFRTFQVDAAYAGRSAQLHFSGVSEQASVWLNGDSVGVRNGYAVPHEFPLASPLEPGENRVAIRLSRKADAKCALSLGDSVSLTFNPENCIGDVFVQPDVRRKRISVSVETNKPARVRLQILGTACETEDDAGTLLLDFPDFEAWSPDTPVLYTLKCSLLSDGEELDSRTVIFGMREFTVKDNRFCLNSRPILVKAVIHEALHPGALEAEERAARSQQEITLAKEAGFNTIQFRGAAPSVEMLDAADALGILVYESLEGTVAGATQDASYRDVVLRDRGRPSVVMWGVGPLPEGEDDGECSVIARNLDPSRLVLGYLESDSEACRQPRLMRPYRNAYEPYDDVRSYHSTPVSAATERYLKNNGHAGAMCFLSETGVAALSPDENADTEGALQLRGLDRVFGDSDGLRAASETAQCEAARAHIDAIRSNKNLAGYGWYRLRDGVGDDGLGLLDAKGNPTALYKMVKDLQGKLSLIIRIENTNLVVRQEVPVSITLMNEEKAEDRVDLSLQVVGPTNQVLWKKKRNLKLVRTGKEIWNGSISASGSPGPHRFVVRLMKTMKVVAESSVAFHVGETPEKCNDRIHVLDRDAQWTERCRLWATTDVLTAPIHIVPPLANTIRAYPDNELVQVLAQVREGAVALVFSPPADWNDFAEQLEDCPRVTSVAVPKARVGMYHYTKIHPVFEGLPIDGLMRRAYANVATTQTFLEQSDEDITGSVVTEGGTASWGHGILVQRFGSGRLVCVSLRILEHLGRDRLADRMFVNLINHFVRRSVPSSRPAPPDRKAVEWLRQERLEGVRRWTVIGEFANPGGAGHATAYPQEEAVDLEATYPGWYQAVSWRSWYAGVGPGAEIDLQAALSAEAHPDRCHHYGTGYAYAEFRSDRRQHVALILGLRGPTKIWLNNKLVHESDIHHTARKLREVEVEGYIREGKNTLLVKSSRRPGPCTFSLDIETADTGPLQITWWK